MQMFLDARELAVMRGVKAQTVINWAKDGYPIDGGEKIPIPGVDKSGRKWVFDRAKTIKFFEKLKEKRWQMYTDLNTKTQKPGRQKRQKFGTIDSKLTVKSSGELLMNRLNLPH